MGATISHHLEKTATAVEILKILLKVGRELLDLAGQDSDLHIGGAAVLVMSCYALYNGRFYSFR